MIQVAKSNCVVYVQKKQKILHIIFQMHHTIIIQKISAMWRMTIATTSDFGRIRRTQILQFAFVPRLPANRYFKWLRAGGTFVIRHSSVTPAHSIGVLPLARCRRCVDGVRLIGCERAFVGWLARAAPRDIAGCLISRAFSAAPLFRTVQFKSDPNGRSIVRLFARFWPPDRGGLRRRSVIN